MAISVGRTEYTAKCDKCGQFMKLSEYSRIRASEECVRRGWMVTQRRCLCLKCKGDKNDARTG